MGLTVLQGRGTFPNALQSWHPIFVEKSLVTVIFTALLAQVEHDAFPVMRESFAQRALRNITACPNAASSVPPHRGGKLCFCS